MGLYLQIIEHLKRYGDVLTEHIGDGSIGPSGESEVSDVFVHDRDLNWLMESDVVIAEVSTPSIGVGYEIGRAVESNKAVLCLYRTQVGKKLSAMISGCMRVTNARYATIGDAKETIDDFFTKKIACSTKMGSL